MANCLISIGANIGDVTHTIDAAIKRLDSHSAVKIVKQSQLLVTKPVGGPTGQSDFVNAAVLLETTLEPIALLAVLQSLELDAGRTRSVRWGERTLDLDIILFDDQICDQDQLILPHPRMAFRRFVLEPAAEIAPEMQHPVTGRSVAEMLDHINTAKNYVAVTGLPGTDKTRLVEVACERTGSVPVFGTLPKTSQFESPSSSVDAELEFVQQRVALLNAAVKQSDTSYVISDFWIGQSLTYAAELLSTDERQLDTAFRDSVLPATSPKLIVLIESQLDRQSDTESNTLEHRQSRLRESLLNVGQAPILRLNTSDVDWNVEELVAAIHAM